MSRLIVYVCAMALVSVAMAQADRDEDFFSSPSLSLPSISSFVSSPFMGPSPFTGIGSLLSDLDKDVSPSFGSPTSVRMFRIPLGSFRMMPSDENDNTKSQATSFMQPRIRVFRLPSLPSLDGLVNRMVSDTPRSLPERFSRLFSEMNCDACSRVKSNMRSVRIMMGPDGKTVHTTTEQGPDGVMHTTRTVSDGSKPSDDVNGGNVDLPDILSSFIVPLAGLNSLSDDEVSSTIATQKFGNAASRVQSHMKAISVVHGRDGKTVQTVSEQGPDGKIHTTRSVFDMDGNKVTENTPVLSRKATIAPSAVSTSVKVDAPKEAAPVQKSVVVSNGLLMRWSRNLHNVQSHPISTEAAKDAVTSAINVNAKDVSKLHDENARKEIAKTIADKLGIKESDVQISIDNSGVKVSAASKKEEPVAVKTAPVKPAPAAEEAKTLEAATPVVARKAPVKVKATHQRPDLMAD
eukprot:753096-Hanusia_phi.AAC.1